MSTPFMPLLAFELGGTISIPSSFPTPGRIMLGQIVDPDGMPQIAVDLLRIEQKLSERVLIARTILLSDVRAIWLADNCENPDWARGVWIVGADAVMPKVIDCLGGARGHKRRPARSSQAYLLGSVFAPEAARVLMDVSVGMTLAESAEYYPPLVRDRTDGHYNMGDCHHMSDCHHMGDCHHVSHYHRMGDCH